MSTTALRLLTSQLTWRGVKAVVAMFRSAVPDLRVVVEDMIAEGGKVAVR